jgi:hypothetical protein
LKNPAAFFIIKVMERIVHKSTSFAEAQEWDIRQAIAMSPEERLAAAKVLRDRFYPPDSPDVRACHLRS